MCAFLCATPNGGIPAKVLKINGGDDETRTRDLCRDSEKFNSIFNDLENADGTTSHWKYWIGKIIVYHDVYRKIWLDKRGWPPHQV